MVHGSNEVQNFLSARGGFCVRLPSETRRNVPDASGWCLAKFAVESQFHRINMLIYTAILEWL